MIYDKIENAGRYRGLSPWLDKALDFLAHQDLGKLPLGRTEILGQQVFANVMEAQAKDEAEGAYEIHKRYMDIQIDLEGVEKIMIGLDSQGPLAPYDEMTDFGTVRCEKAAECVMGPGRFIVCMGEEPHMPGIAAEEERRLKKCVIKVAVG